MDLFKTCKKLIKNSVEETRLVSHNFMPRTLEQFGLEKTIESVVNNYKRIKQEIKFEFQSNLDSTRFNQELELSIFRVIQELLNNAIKHAKASLIQVNLNLLDGELVAVVTDNGVGVEVQEEDYKDGIGLRNIRERINYLGGKLDIRSADLGRGICARVSVKY